MSRRHPSVLYLLCLIEGCERFAASAMLSMFMLYLIQHRKFGDAMAVLVVGGFLAGSYLASWPGGWLADRFLGAPRSARLGTLLLAVGYALLWIDSSELSWPALGLVIVGQGFFRSALTTLVGQLYVADDERREAGFGFLYVSVNVGYLVGPVCAEVVRGRAGWPSIFGLATVALLLAQALFIVGGAFFSRQTIPASGNGDVLPSSRVEQSRIQALWLLSVVAVVFWLANQQSATSLMLFAKHNTNLSLSLGPWTVRFAPAHFTTLHGALVLVFTPFLIRTLSMLRARKLAPSTPAQLNRSPLQTRSSADGPAGPWLKSSLAVGGELGGFSGHSARLDVLAPACFVPI